MSGDFLGVPRHDPVDRARAILTERRTIGEYFDPQLFGDPCYDILLELFVAEAEGKHAGVTGHQLGAGVPHTTALRWINLLESRGIVEFEPAAGYRHDRIVRLSPDARDRLCSFLAKTNRRV